MDYDYARGIELECKQCHQRWVWPRPKYKMKIYPPDNCPECRNKEIEQLNKHIELLKEIHEDQVRWVKGKINGLIHHSKEYMLPKR